MAEGANSYGTDEEVAALTKRYTNAGVFDTNTNPTIAQVEQFIDRRSGLLNVKLSALGFDIPVTQATVKLMLDDIVVSQVSELVFYANSAGRFHDNQKGRQGIGITLDAELNKWLEENAEGMEALGASRSAGTGTRLGFRATDEAGDDTFPIFERDAFGNDFTEWDQS